MSQAINRPRTVSVKRVVLLTIGLAPAVLLVLIGLVRLYDRIPGWVYWKAGLILLIAAEFAYGVTVALTVLGMVVLGVVWVRTPGSWTSRRRLSAARGLLLCGSLVIALVLGEAIAALWLIRARNATAMPAGGQRWKPSWQPMGPTPEVPVAIQPPTEFPDPPGDRTIDLVVMGESSAAGIPYEQWVSIGNLLVCQLGEVLPNRPVRLEVLACSGETLELQHQRLNHLLRRPDLLIVYCGHNEFSSRLDLAREPDHYFDERLPTVWSLLVKQIEVISPICGLIRETAEKCRIAIPPPREGHRALVDVPAYTSTEATILLVDFRRRLEAIVSYAERVGAMPVLIAPAANDAGFEPNRSFLPAATPRSERAAFARQFLAARRQEAADPAAARAAYRALLARQPGFAETHYRLAQLLERAGEEELAYRHYREARDLDGYPMRCLTTFQTAYRDVAARHGCILVDAQSYFHAIGRRGLLDDHLFHDGMHPSLRGQIALAQAVLQALKARGAFGWPKTIPTPRIDPARCAAHFGMGPHAWRYLCLWGIMFYDLTYPMRHDSSRRLEQKRAFARAAERIAAGESPEAVGLPNIGVPAAVPAVFGYAEAGPTTSRPGSS